MGFKGLNLGSRDQNFFSSSLGQGWGPPGHRTLAFMMCGVSYKELLLYENKGQNCRLETQAEGAFQFFIKFTKRCQFSDMKQPTWLTDYIKGFIYSYPLSGPWIYAYCYFEVLVLCCISLSERTIVELLTSKRDIVSWVFVFMFLCWDIANWS